jgi:hypothetical protein
MLAACSGGGYQPVADTSTIPDGIDTIDASDSVDVSTEGCGDCPPGTECYDGVCRSTCVTDGDCPGILECCDAHCYNTSSEPYHCGGCGNRCLPEGNACLSGICSCNGAAACAEGLTCCSTGGCLDTMWDRNNCGDCGVRCPEGVMCIGGTCGGSCADHGCPDIPHGTSACDGSECVVSDCDEGWIDGDGLFENGCECASDVTDLGGPSCSEAYFLGEFPDSPASSVEVSGFASTDEPDWYYFIATDTPDTDCDTFHAALSFLANPDGIYQIDVYTGTCDGDLVCDDDTTFEVNTAFSAVEGDELRGECPCTTGDPDATHTICSDNSISVYFQVHLAEGVATPGCEPYTITVSNGS